MGTPRHANALVLFGITGDLAAKMLLPALYRLTERGILDIPVVGVAYSDWDDDALRAHARLSITAAVGAVDERVLAKLSSQLSIVTGDFNDPATFAKLKEAVGGKEFVSHYLAIPPALFAKVAASLADVGLNKDARLVVEKPFGHDLASAKELDAELCKYFEEENLLRVDHFLGDVAVESMKAVRFANTLLTPIWNREYIDNIQINLVEDFGVADRGSFYDSVGCLKDVVQNHLLQVFAFLTMEPPSAPTADAERLERWKVLNATRAIDPAESVRGQYDGYLGVEGVKPGSTTETYFAARLWVDNWRWQGVPIYLRSGKCLSTTSTEVVVELRRPPITLYPGPDGKSVPNLLRFLIVPEAALSLDLVVRQPEDGEAPKPAPVRIDLSEVYGRVEQPYENILEGAITGNPSYFAALHAVEECWRIVENVLTPQDPPQVYEPGTWGPKAADTLPGPAGWHDVTAEHH